MKCIFVCEQRLLIYLANGEPVPVKHRGRPCYQYKEKPSFTSGIYAGEDAWGVLLRYIGMSEGDKTLFKKRVYINHSDIGKIVYKDELEKIVLLKEYLTIDNPNIKLLQDDLGFREYTELVYDRERELKCLYESK